MTTGPSTSKLFAAIGIASAVVVGGIAFTGYTMLHQTPEKDDVGVQFCTAIATKDARNDDSDMTEKEYKRLRNILNQSRYDDIKEPGTKFLDLAWQVQKLPEDDFGAFAYIGPIGQAYADLSTGCANHGYPLPPLTSGPTPVG